jgi:hypothetical protein
MVSCSSLRLWHPSNCSFFNYFNSPIHVGSNFKGEHHCKSNNTNEVRHHMVLSNSIRS